MQSEIRKRVCPDKSKPRSSPNFFLPMRGNSFTPVNPAPTICNLPTSDSNISEEDSESEQLHQNPKKKLKKLVRKYQQKKKELLPSVVRILTSTVGNLILT